jgi:hypothetical protein
MAAMMDKSRFVCDLTDMGTQIIVCDPIIICPGDVGEFSENINIIRDAVVFYRPNKHWNISFGQTKLPEIERVNSSGGLQLTDRSINNTRFTIDRDFGFKCIT